MTDYETFAQRLLGCESRERRGRLWCETHDEPWECPRATEVADELREAWRAELEATREQLVRAQARLRRILDEGFGYSDSEEDIEEVLTYAAAWRAVGSDEHRRLALAEARLDAVRALLDHADWRAVSPMPDFEAMAREHLGCVEDDDDCATHEPCAWPCMSQTVVSLAGLLRRVAADAWDEGYRLDWTGGVKHVNPYRTGADQ